MMSHSACFSVERMCKKYTVMSAVTIFVSLSKLRRTKTHFLFYFILFILSHIFGTKKDIQKMIVMKFLQYKKMGFFVCVCVVVFFAMFHRIEPSMQMK